MNTVVDPELQHKIDHPKLTRDDPSFAAGKMAAFQYLAVAIFLFLLYGFWELQVKQPELYTEAAERNRIKQFPLIAARGKIMDREGRPIVENHSTWAVMTTRENLKEEHLAPIAEALNIDLDEVRARVQKYRKRSSFEPIVLKEDITTADIAFVESHRDPELFPELELIHTQRRIYPKNGLASHIIGYTGEISEAELDNPEFGKFDPGAIVGKFGIERQYNEILTGTDGQRQVEVDNRGRERKVLQTTDATPGKNIQLTLDLELQARTELLLEGKRGAIVALDPRTGEILAMASRPTFDPNQLSSRMAAAEFRKLLNDEGKPFLNRATQSQTAPGSTFKPIVALAGLESKGIDSSWAVHCFGGASFYGTYHKCHLKSGHGDVNLRSAMAQSCDVYFYNVGNKIGIDNIDRYASMAGFGRRTGVDLPGEATGLLPSNQWKIRTMRQRWYAGDTISVAIGQGALTASPLQLASAIGGVARGGKLYRPHFLKSATAAEQPTDWHVNPDNIDKIVDAMFAVVNWGTGTSAHVAGIEVCGKSGTAQTASEDYMKAHHLENNAWFVAFAPRKDPEIVVVAVEESGGHGGTAVAPWVREVLVSYFSKKWRQKAPPQAASPQAVFGGLRPDWPLAMKVNQ